MCATGNLHISWTIWQLLLYFFDHGNAGKDVLIAWFIGAAGGALLGALLNANWSKILIYVSRKNGPHRVLELSFPSFLFKSTYFMGVFVTEERTMRKRNNLAADVANN